jgi:hypothetical protein
MVCDQVPCISNKKNVERGRKYCGPQDLDPSMKRVERATATTVQRFLSILRPSGDAYSRRTPMLTSKAPPYSVQPGCQCAPLFNVEAPETNPLHHFTPAHVELLSAGRLGFKSFKFCVPQLARTAPNEQSLVGCCALTCSDASGGRTKNGITLSLLPVTNAN